MASSSSAFSLGMCWVEGLGCGLLDNIFEQRLLLVLGPVLPLLRAGCSGRASWLVSDSVPEESERGGGIRKTVTSDYCTTTDDEKVLEGSPMSGESLLALAVCHAPQFDGVVIRPSDGLPRKEILKKVEEGDGRAAIFSNVSFTGICSTPLPR
jgi:hypothetical protein